MNESGGLAQTETPSGKQVKLPKLPLRLDGRTFDLRLQPPAVGEGTVDILQLAGLSSQEIETLAAAGIVATRPCRNR
jgi:crotonobetainyl-CoA:carnitine CoA-transferase CaiB-like acyl-CoA transferase